MRYYNINVGEGYAEIVLHIVNPIMPGEKSEGVLGLGHQTLVENAKIEIQVVRHGGMRSKVEPSPIIHHTTAPQAHNHILSL